MSSSSDESSSFDDEISIESGSSDPEVLTETLKKQIETEESVLSLFEKFDTLSSAKDFHMYVIQHFLEIPCTHSVAILELSPILVRSFAGSISDSFLLWSGYP